MIHWSGLNIDEADWFCVRDELSWLKLGDIQGVVCLGVVCHEGVRNVWFIVGELPGQSLLFGRNFWDF